MVGRQKSHTIHKSSKNKQLNIAKKGQVSTAANKIKL